MMPSGSSCIKTVGYAESMQAWNRWAVVLVGTVTAGLGCTAGTAQEPQPTEQVDTRPWNVLLLVSDDQGWGDIGYHNAEMRTPVLDRLAAQGVRLEQHYVQPQCTPTRVALMSGRYPSRFGSHCTQASNERALPAGTATLATVVSGAGYATGMSGKWHLGSKSEWGPLHFGFDHAHGSLAGAVGMYDHRYRLNSPFAETWHRDHQPLQQEGHVTDLVAAEAVRWIEDHRTQPWFFYVPFHAVHTPLVEQDARWFEANAHIEARDRQLFAAAATHLDDAIGRLLKALETSGQRQRTVIVFLSDNGGIHTAYAGGNYPAPDPALKSGFSSNLPFRGGKTTVWEGGMRVPALVWWPGVEARVHYAPMHAVDWLPTLAAMLGIELDAVFQSRLDGVDVSAQLRGAPAHERSFYWVWGANRQRVALRQGRWKLLRNKILQAWQLYDLEADPYETTNLAEAQPGRVTAMVALVQAQHARDARRQD